MIPVHQAKASTGKVSYILYAAATSSSSKGCAAWTTNRCCLLRSYHGPTSMLLQAVSSKDPTTEESEGGHYWLSMLRKTNPDPRMALLPQLPPNDSVKFTDGPPTMIDLSPPHGPSEHAVQWLKLLNQAEDWASGKSPNNPLFDPKQQPKA